jgi:hypothetical protein
MALATTCDESSGQSGSPVFALLPGDTGPRGAAVISASIGASNYFAAGQPMTVLAYFAHTSFP